MREPRYDTALRALVNGFLDMLAGNPPIGELPESDRIDGKTCLITGANSGLGKATAVELARRGGRIIMACRSGIPEAGEDVKRLSGSENIEMVRLDLADFASIRAFCKELRTGGVTIDRTVLNAGVVPKEARRTAQGFEEMFGVNYLGNYLLVTSLLADGTIPNRTWVGYAGRSKEDSTLRHQAAAELKTSGRPRIIFVSSETHRSAQPPAIESLGSFENYTIGKSLARYGQMKLLLQTFAVELTRRFSDTDGIDIAVHSLCPGPVNTKIAREAPKLLQPLVGLILLFFKSPKKASRPVVFLACSPQIEGETGIYLHVMTRKEPSEQARNREYGKTLWEKSRELTVSPPGS
jgi:NAD(P)-dependent dehydrogenase (short-subunit alcohol dehydrogenase family)